MRTLRPALARLAVVAPAVVLVGVLAGCGGSSPAVSAASGGQSLPAGTYPAGISLQVDAPICQVVGQNTLCQLSVWYANGTTDTVTIDATSTVVKDTFGATYSGTTDDAARTLVIDPNSRQVVLWSVKLPPGGVPKSVVWVAPDGRTASALLRVAVSPTPSATESPSETPSASPSVTATPTPTPTKTATPTPTPKPTKTATPKPTRTSTPKPPPSSTAPPDGSIG